MRKTKITKVYVENNICFGRDTRGNNIMIYALEPLKLLQVTDLCALVKKCGREQRRKYAILNDLWKFGGANK